MSYKLLGVGHDAKTVKGEKKGYLTGILYLAPHTIAGGRSMCPFSTAGCRAVCLYTAGRGGFNSVQQARIRKTKWWQTDPSSFLTQLETDIERLVGEGLSRGLTPAVRLNGTSDVAWENTHIMERFPGVQFYDYTKFPSSHRTSLPAANYHLTFSYSEHPLARLHSEGWFERGVNTAVVFPTADLPGTFLGRPVIDGDESDLRFTDPKGIVVGLKAKGKARKSDSAFVQQKETTNAN